MEEVESVKKLILQRLIRSNIWGGKHIPLNFVYKCLPGHYKNNQGKKLVEKALKELTNLSFVIILPKKTGKGVDDHISLNSRKVSEIKQFLES